MYLYCTGDIALMSSARFPFTFSHRVRQVLLASMLCVGVVVLVAGWLQFRTRCTINTIEWNGDALDVMIFPDATHQTPPIRALFFPLSPAGEAMIALFLQSLADVPYIQSQNHNTIKLAASKNALAEARYLDVYAQAYAFYFRINWHLKQRFASTLPVIHNDADTAHADIQPLFTYGQPGQPDNRLVDTLRELTQRARPGSTIQFSVFLFYYDNPDEPLLQELLLAASRGVNVQLLVDLPETDHGSHRTAGMQFKEAFEKKLLLAAQQGHSASWISALSPRADKYKNHTKIFLFSDVGTQLPVAIITSENLMDRDREKYQAGIIIQDQEIFNHLQNVWHAIHEQQYQLIAQHFVSHNMAGIFFPLRDSGDPLCDLLMRMRSSSTLMNQGKLFISMARWDKERFALAYYLRQLAAEGIHVELIMRSNEEIVDPMITALLQNQPNIKLLSADVNKINIHSKYMLFDGYYQSPGTSQATHEYIVWTGSHNFTGAGLHDNYETWLEIHDSDLYKAFLENFDRTRQLFN